MKRITLFLVVLAALIASAHAQVGRRIAPWGTFQGDPSVLRSVASGQPEIHRYFTSLFGAGWDEPGALEVRGEPTDIPVGGTVFGNALMGTDGKIRPCVTVQGRTDGRPDKGWYVFNKKSGMGSWMKSCCQGFTDKPPAKPEIPVYETDFENKITIHLGFDFNLTATARSDSEATAMARGGNATIYNMPPQMFLPQRRSLGASSTEMYTAFTLNWVPVPKMTQNNNQSQQQQQQQWQEQWQQMWQQQQQSLELWLKEHGFGGDPEPEANFLHLICSTSPSYGLPRAA